MQQVEFWTKNPFASKEFTDNHVLSDNDANNLDKMAELVLSLNNRMECYSI